MAADQRMRRPERDLGQADPPRGWGDTYSAQLPGQAFDVTRLPNGRYVIRTEVNPLGLLSELTNSNNTASRMVRISGKGAARRARAGPWKGIRG